MISKPSSIHFGFEYYLTALQRAEAKRTLRTETDEFVRFLDTNAAQTIKRDELIEKTRQLVLRLKETLNWD